MISRFGSARPLSGVAGTADAFETNRLFPLDCFVIDSEQAAVRGNLREADVLSQDVGPDIRRQLLEVSMHLEGLSKLLAGRAIDDPGAIDMSAEMEVTRVRCRDDPPLHGLLHVVRVDHRDVVGRRRGPLRGGCDGSGGQRMPVLYGRWGRLR